MCACCRLTASMRGVQFGGPALVRQWQSAPALTSATTCGCLPAQRRHTDKQTHRHTRHTDERASSIVDSIGSIGFSSELAQGGVGRLSAAY